MTAWRFLARLFQDSRGLVAASIAAAVVQSLLLLPIAVLVRDIFDEVIPDEDVRTLFEYGAAILVLFLASSLIGLAARYWALKATKGAITELRGQLVERLYTLRQAYFDRADHGRLHSTIVQDTERLDMMNNGFLGQLLPAALIGAALSVMLVVLSWSLFLILVCLLPLLVITGRLLGGRVRGRMRVYQRTFDTWSAHMGFVLRSMYLTKAQAAEPRQLEQARAKIADVGEVGRGMVWAIAAYTLVTGAVAAIAGVVVLVAGGAAVAQGRMTSGELLAFFAVLALLRAQVTVILIIVPQVIAGLESLRRLAAILDTDEPEPYQGTAGHEFAGGVRLDRVAFTYGERPVLRDVSLEIGAGEHVALVGANGAGKSTIVSLILGLYRPESGALAADGRAYDDVDLHPVRRKIGVVLQDPPIFPGTIRDNIGFGLGSTDGPEIEEAAERATAAEFVRRLPDGFDTVVGSEGVGLSGGQRQRIAIARALVGRPALIILDEPATYLDPQATAALIENLSNLPWNPSLLVIAHGEALFPDVERTYLLRDGAVEIVGSAVPAA